MQTVKVIPDGKYQKIQFPHNYIFKDKDLIINKIGDCIILFPSNKRWETFQNGLNGFSEDFMSGSVGNIDEQIREGL